MSRPAAVPIDCRDQLYALFVQALAGKLTPEQLLVRGRTLAMRADWRAYVQERILRFERALRACQMMLSEPDALTRDLRIGASLFNEGLFFDCHEYLEGAWRRAEGEDKLMLQGLVQAAAGLHKFELGSPDGAAELLEKAAAKLRQASAPRWAFAPGFVSDIDDARRRLLEGSFDPGSAPKLRIP